jgi:hypothetical protein
MKKFLMYLFLVLMFCCNAVLAQSSLSECEGSPFIIKKFSVMGGNTAAKLKLMKWENCFGTLVKKNGSQYVGEFENGKFSGQGTYTYNDGTIYEGSFFESRSDGYGTMKYGNGDIYDGEFVRGKFSGLGKYTFYGGGFDHGIWKKGELIERLEEGATAPKKESEKDEAQVAKKEESVRTESSLPECEGSPREAKNKFSVGLMMFKWNDCEGVV